MTEQEMQAKIKELSDKLAKFEDNTESVGVKNLRAKLEEQNSLIAKLQAEETKRIEAEKKAEELSLAEQGKFKQLAEEKDKVISELQAKMNNITARQNISQALAKESLDSNSLDYVSEFIASRYKANEDGTNNLSELIAQTKEKSPSLFKSPAEVKIGTNVASQNNANGVGTMTKEVAKEMINGDWMSYSPEERQAATDAMK